MSFAFALCNTYIFRHVFLAQKSITTSVKSIMHFSHCVDFDDALHCILLSYEYTFAVILDREFQGAKLNYFLILFLFLSETRFCAVNAKCQEILKELSLNKVCKKVVDYQRVYESRNNKRTFFCVKQYIKL